MDLADKTSAQIYAFPVDPESDTAGAHVLQLVGRRKNVLEIGAGPGSIARPLVEFNGCRVTAVEIDSDCIPILRGFCAHVVQADLNDVTWRSRLPGGDFDAVVIADVLEHLYDPWTALRQAREVVGADGCVVVSIPNASHASILACLLKGDFRYGEWGLLDRTHIRFFGLENIQSLIEDAGLKVVEARFVFRNPDQTEFADMWRALPQEDQRFLMSGPTANVYQVVVKAVPAETNDGKASRSIAEFLSPEPSSVKYIAFYLPQFHPIPENDKWWGKGFTEWTNVAKAWPMFEGHYQPHLPADLGYYDLRVPDVRRDQIAYARKFGIDAFCFHYYWFGGRRILERPVEEYLQDATADLPFCLCWANENWTRRWDASESEILIAQTYSPEDDLAFIRGLLRFFRDPRYVRVDGKPVLVVYRPQQLPDAQATVRRWRKVCQDSGIGGIHLIAALTHGNWSFAELGFDAGVEFPPHDVRVQNRAVDVKNFVPLEGLVVQYTEVAERYLANDYRDRLVYRGVYPSWDNTARLERRAVVTVDANPENYEQWLRRATNLTERERDPEHRLVFINAWNEWAEGCHLEPDQKFGLGFLEATSRVKARQSVLAMPYRRVSQTDRAVTVNNLRFVGWLKRRLRPYPRLHMKAQLVWRDLRRVRAIVRWKLS
jgi:2-polyprenyl-3-methyl-5-hydroxy-6-metoxy-1,4-benzoquinol methylase